MTMRLFVLLAMLNVLIIIVLVAQGTLYNLVNSRCQIQTKTERMVVIATPSATLTPTLKLRK